jgi:hypothetical protein
LTTALSVKTLKLLSTSLGPNLLQELWPGKIPFKALRIPLVIRKYSLILWHNLALKNAPSKFVSACLQLAMLRLFSF